MKAEDLLEIIKSRRSIRRYKSLPVEEEKLRLILEAARWAPSAGNLQPWHFLIVRDKRLREMLAEAAYGQTWMVEAPVYIVVLADPERSSYRYGDRGRALYCIQDTALAIQNIMLMAHALGLGTCFVGAFDERSVSKILCIPKGLRPVAIITIGYPAESPEPRPRRPLDDIVSRESFC
ncbi:MAG TPA: nitroreductase family protein [Thermoprotei archaeon]|nr:nitroreductase family protein [Euryarchaeota archaeon]HDJ51225.1 nitroreductase family protein [Thermoprotei archaeon]